MLNRLRQKAPAVALLICVTLLATWLTGAHGHRHVGGHEHEQALHGWGGVHSEHNHSHDLAPEHATTADLATSIHFAGEHFEPHSLTLNHADGHENIEIQALQPPAGKTMPDLLLLVLLFCAVFVLTRTRTLVVPVVTEPPDPRRAYWSLGPPLRGPPSFSVI